MKKLKYVKLFENWTQEQGNGFTYYDSKKFELAKEKLSSSSEKVKMNSDEVKQIEEAIKKYLKTDILKINLKYDPYNNKTEDWWQVIPASDNRVWRPHTNEINCWVEKFEGDQYLVKFVKLPVPSDKYKLGLVKYDPFGYVINGLEHLDSWVKASPIDTGIEAYKCLASGVLRIKDRINTNGELKVYTGGLSPDLVNKILENYSSIQDFSQYHNGKKIYLFGDDHQQFGIIEKSLHTNLHVRDEKDLEMLKEKLGLADDAFDIYR